MSQCPLCLQEASCEEQQAPRPLHRVNCPSCGSLILTPGAVSYLEKHPADDPRRSEYSRVLRMVKRRDRPIDPTTLKMWRDWLRVALSGRIPVLAQEGSTSP